LAFFCGFLVALHIFKNMLEKLKQRWKLKTNWDIFLILLVFTIAGFSAKYTRFHLFEYFGFNDLHIIPWFLLFILIIFPAHQIYLFIFGFIVGKFKFFLDFEVKLMKKIGFKWLFKK
jgi:hypothetical protein